MALTDKLSAIGDAIREKTGKTELLTLEAMAEEIGAIETGGGGDTSIEDGLITGKLTNYTNDRVTHIAGYTWSGNKNIVSVSFDNVSQIKKELFKGATSLQSVSFPSATSFGGTNVFSGCTALKSVYLPKIAVLQGYEFRDCTSLEEICLPCFYSNGSGNNFNGCKALKKADFGRAVTANSTHNFICPNMFAGCSVFDTLIIRHPNVRSISSNNAFDNTPFAIGGTGGLALVPTALVTSYETATNWSALYTAGTCTFLPLEEYTLDGTTTGEIDMAKVEAKLEELYGGAGA